MPYFTWNSALQTLQKSLGWRASKASLFRDLAAFDSKFTWSAAFVFKILQGTNILLPLTCPFFSLAISLTSTRLMCVQAWTREEGVLQNRGVCGPAFLFPSSPSPSHLCFALAPFPAHPIFGNRLWSSENATETLATQATMPGLIKMKDFTGQLTLSPRAEWSFRLVANSWLLVPDGEISVMLKSPLWRCCNVMLSCTCSSFLISEAVLEHADVFADRIRLPEARINLLDYNVIAKRNKTLLLTRIWNRWGS